MPPRGSADRFRLDDKVVLLTGASSGLGAQWAPVLADAGATVVMTARRADVLEQVASAVSSAIAVPGDVTSSADRLRMVDAALAVTGRIDVLINNAGLGASAPAAEMAPDDVRRVIDTDLTALFELTQLVGRQMIAARTGSIINIASLAAERAVDRYPLAVYSAAKAGVVALTRNLAQEWGPAGVRVNAIGPGFFPSEMTGQLEDAEQVAWIVEHTALRRIPAVDELDGTILFLAADASSYVTGQHLLVDGGWTVY